jgi:hypothetical protein
MGGPSIAAGWTCLASGNLLNDCAAGVCGGSSLETLHAKMHFIGQDEYDATHICRWLGLTLMGGEQLISEGRRKAEKAEKIITTKGCKSYKTSVKVGFRVKYLARLWID